jgi:hypothetical protein
MNAKDIFAIVLFTVVGAAAGFQLAEWVGALVGLFTGLGALVVTYWIATVVDDILRDHYRTI